MSQIAKIFRTVELENLCKQYASPVGEAENTRCERAERMIREAVDQHGSFSEAQRKAIKIFAQGSYRNGTNITTDSDVDIAVCYTGSFFTDYSLADGMGDLDFGNVPATYSFHDFRLDVAIALQEAFGRATVDFSGNKSFKVPGNTCRIGADVVPCFEFRQYLPRSDPLLGTRFISMDQKAITNWPDYHYHFGVSKNVATKYRFKKVVRVLKALRRHLAGNSGNAPSFLIESMVWNVADQFFGEESSYVNTCAIIKALGIMLCNPTMVSQMTEVNRLKQLFSGEQIWTLDEAKLFIWSAGKELLLWQ